MTSPPPCPLETSWCAEHEPNMNDTWAECVRIVGTVLLDHGPATSGFRSDPAGGVPQQVVISVRQLEGDLPRIDVDWPDSTADFPGLQTWTPREARLIGGFMLTAAGLLDGST